MSVRFRVRTSRGQEVTFASLEMFAEFVRSGDLSPDDVVYDAETREWSSALTHPVVLQIESESEDDAQSGDTGAAEIDESPEAGDVAPEPPAADIGLQLAPAQEQLTPEQASAAFVKKMEAERASDLEFDEEPALQGFTMEQGTSGLVGGIADGIEEPRSPAPSVSRSRDEPRREERRRDESRWEEPRREAPPRRETKAPPRKKSGVGRKYAPLVIVGVVVVAGGVYFGPELLAPTTGEEQATGGEGVAVPARPAPLIPDTEEALRERAQERFLTTTRALLRDLPPIPDVWLQGVYLAAPSDYPQVRDVWSQYLTTIRQVRAGDNERYRAGYLRALDDAQVEGSARALRLAQAVGTFQGAVASRAAHYDRAEALANAAIRGHDALVEAEGTIAYEPAASSPVSGDPVVQAVGRNPDAQAFLDQVLDMVLTELDGPEGPGRTSNVSEWIWNGILDAITS